VATTTGLMTIEQFYELPETQPFYYELHHGELVQVCRPKLKHTLIQHQLQELLKRAVPNMFVGVEFPFRALPQYEFRVADVVLVSHERIKQADLDDVLRGAPELVVEVLSPSNTMSEINDREKLCLENGAREFWVVDPDLRQVKVSRPDGITTTFHADQQISLAAFEGGALKIDDIFR
jgi:Uma2 family endonuclease